MILLLSPEGNSCYSPAPYFVIVVVVDVIVVVLMVTRLIFVLTRGMFWPVNSFLPCLFSVSFPLCSLSFNTHWGRNVTIFSPFHNPFFIFLSLSLFPDCNNDLNLLLCVLRLVCVSFCIRSSSTPVHSLYSCPSSGIEEMKKRISEFSAAENQRRCREMNWVN